MTRMLYCVLSWIARSMAAITVPSVAELLLSSTRKLMMLTRSIRPWKYVLNSPASVSIPRSLMCSGGAIGTLKLWRALCTHPNRWCGHELMSSAARRLMLVWASERQARNPEAGLRASKFSGICRRGAPGSTNAIWNGNRARELSWASRKLYPCWQCDWSSSFPSILSQCTLLRATSWSQSSYRAKTALCFVPFSWDATWSGIVRLGGRKQKTDRKWKSVRLDGPLN